MRAIRIQGPGGPDQLQITDVTDPEPGPGQVLVAVEAAGVNFIDIYLRTGLYPAPFPNTPGSEAAGTVAAVGDEVAGFAPGDRVAYTGVGGAYAELAAVPADRLVGIPAGVETTAAAAVMLQGMTAHYLSHDTFPLGPSHTCLVHAGAGGVGRLLIQMAKQAGATVATTVSTAAKEELARAAGADHVIRYTEVDFATAATELLGDRPFDVVYDSVGMTTFDAGLGLLKPRGTMALYGQSSGPVGPVDLQVLNANGSLFVTRPSLPHHIATRSELERRAGDLFGWMASGRLDVLVGSTYPLAEAAAAHSALEGRATVGKVLLIP